MLFSRLWAVAVNKVSLVGSIMREEGDDSVGGAGRLEPLRRVGIF